MELENDILVWKHMGRPQPQSPEEEELSNFNFFDLPQLPPPLVTLSLEDKVIRLEETMSKEFQRLEEQQQAMMEQ